MHGDDVIGKIDSKGDNHHEVPLLKELMKSLTIPPVRSVVLNRNPYGSRVAREEEVFFIRKEFL